MALRTLDVADGFASAGVPSEVPLPIGAATQATLAAILAELLLKADLLETQPISASSLPLPAGAATQATLAAILAELLLKADLLETQPVSIASMPITAVTGTFYPATQPVSIAAPLAITNQTQTGSFDEDLTVSTTPETFTAPTGAFACFIETDDSNTTNMRVKMGGTASPTSGIQFQGGRSEFYQGGSNISYCAESGTGKISIQWFVRI